MQTSAYRDPVERYRAIGPHTRVVAAWVLPSQFPDGESAESRVLTGEETFDIAGVVGLNDGATPREVTIRAGDQDFQARLRIDTPPRSGPLP